MDKFKKIANIGVWIAALVMAVYLAVTTFLEANPFPTDAPAEPISVEQPVGQ